MLGVFLSGKFVEFEHVFFEIKKFSKQVLKGVAVLSKAHIHGRAFLGRQNMRHTGLMLSVFAAAAPRDILHRLCSSSGECK